MKYKGFVRIFIVSILAIVYVSCNHAKELTVNNSTFNSSRSHNMGQNCMSCHKKGGQGEGWYTAAGTAYHTNNSTAQNVLVKLYTLPNGAGNLVKEIPGDLLGNFYTTDIMSFATGLYPVVENNGVKSYMSSSISSGSCNSCHGVSTSRITID